MLIVTDSWKAQLAEKLNTIHKKLDEVPSKTWKFTAELMNAYKESVAAAMGSVGIRGGVPHMEIKGYKDDSVQWASLSPYTVAKKAGVGLPKQGGYLSQDELQEIWDKNAESMKIWYHTGKAQSSIIALNDKVVINDSYVAAYIKKVDQGADTSDYGGPIPARPLFKAMGILFHTYVKTELANKQSKLYKEIVSEITKEGLL